MQRKVKEDGALPAPLGNHGRVFFLRPIWNEAAAMEQRGRKEFS